MARRGIVKAESEMRQTHRDRLLYLSRNSEFLQDIENLCLVRDSLPGKSGDNTWERLSAVPAFQERLEEAGKKWQVPWDLLSQLSWRGWHHGREHKERVVAAATSLFFDSPVVAWTDTPDPWVASLLGADSQPTPGGDRYLNLRVDLDQPIASLLPLIEREIGPHSKRYRQGKRRSKKVEFHIQVYDLVLSGDNFKTIASKLKQRPSTVIKAYLAGSRNIFGSSTAVLPRKRRALASFDLEKHYLKCRACSAARTVKDLCQLAQLYAGQDQRAASRREIGGLDTTREIRRSATMHSPISHPVR